MRYTTDMPAHMCPGPGDSETWGPCTGHPGDPRTEDATESPAFESKKDGMTEDRFKDLNGWFIESITESSDENLAELRDAIQSGDNLKAGDIVSDMVYRYITPADEVVLEELNQEPDEGA